MRTLETNDWVVLNDIIYYIYTMDDFDEMRLHFLEHMQMILDFDAAHFSMASPEEKNRLTNSVSLNCDANFAWEFDEIDYSRGIMYSGKSMVYRETDIISDETRMQSDYYRSVYVPNKWCYSLQMILAKSGKFLGVVTFYRKVGKPDFEYFDIFIMDMLKDHLSYRLERQLKEKTVVDSKISLDDAVVQYGLTKREHMILGLLLKGEETSDVCDSLSISLNTLKKHILNIYRKLGINSRSQMFKLIREPK